MKKHLILLATLACLPALAIASLFDNVQAPSSAGRYHLDFKQNRIRISDTTALEKWLNTDLHSWLKLSRHDQLKLLTTSEAKGTFRFYRLQQTHNDIPVVGLETVLTTRNGSPFAILGKNRALDHLPTKPVVDFGKALQISKLEKNRRYHQRIVYLYKDKSKTRLSYELTGSFKTDSGIHYQTVYIDALTGSLLGRHSHEHGARKRYILDVKSACRAVGINRPVKYKKMYKLYYYMIIKNKFIVRTENSRPVNVRGIDKFHTLLGNAYTFFKSTYNMDSLNNNGIPLVGFARVRYNRKGRGPQCVGNDFNATWIGSLNALFVPENAIDFVEVVAHELAHGIISNGSKLIYRNQSGALNESIADAIGVSFRAWLNAGGSINNPVTHFTSSRSVWKLRAPGGRILRNLANPKSALSRYPDHFADYVRTRRDHGGVHTNSNIINQAFYILSVGGNHPRLRTGPVVKGIGIRKASQIFALAGSNILTPTSNFEDARYAFALAARTLFGRGSQEWVSVHKSMDAVGISGNWSMPARTQPRVERQPPVSTPAPKPRKTKTLPATRKPHTHPAPKPRVKPPHKHNKKITAKKKKIKKPVPPPVKKTPKWVWLSLIGLGLFISIVILIRMRPRYDDKPQFQLNQADDVNNTAQKNITHVANSMGTLIAMDHSESIPLDSDLLNSAEGIVIGRAPELVHVVMESNDVSRRHIRIRNYGGQLYIEDMNSSFGSQIDGYPLQAFKPVKLKDRQIIRIAGHSYQFIRSA